jgi:hypothetical protein
VRISKAKFTIFVIVSALTAMSSRTQGATIFSNLGPGDSLASPGERGGEFGAGLRNGVMFHSNK